MKIGIYSICKNEEANMENWWKQVKGADAVFCLDTGSTDGTKDFLQSLYDNTDRSKFSYGRFCEPYEQRPFRFDEARNMSLSGLTWTHSDLDYVVWVDFDETFEDGWIDKLKTLLKQGKPCMAHFTFTLGSNQFYQGRAHRPHKYTWKYPAHEVLVLKKEDGAQEYIQHTDIQVTQPVKNERPNYTKLLELGHKEINDGRSSYYLGREYYYDERWEEASSVLRYCLYHANGWECERGEAANMLSVIHERLGAPEYIEKYLHLYIAHCNLQREPYIEFARYCYDREDWLGVLFYANKASTIPRPASNFLNVYDANYREVPHDYMSTAYDRMGDFDSAAYHAATCLSYEPNNSRYQQNVQYYIGKGVIKIDQHDKETTSD